MGYTDAQCVYWEMVRRTYPPNESHLTLLGNNFSCTFLHYGPWILLKSGTGMSAYWVAADLTSIKECISSTGKGIVFPLVGQKPEQKVLRCQINIPKSTSREVWGTSKSTVSSQIYLLLVHMDSCVRRDVKGQPSWHAWWGTEHQACLNASLDLHFYICCLLG